MFDSGSGDGGGGDKPKIKLPSVEVAGGELKPAKLPLGAYGLRYTRKFAAGGQTGYRKAADGCAKRGKTRGTMV